MIRSYKSLASFHLLSELYSLLKQVLKDLLNKLNRWFPSPLGVIFSLTSEGLMFVVGNVHKFPSPLGVIFSLNEKNKKY